MSAHPSLEALGARLLALQEPRVALNVSKLGTDLCTEVTTLGVLHDLVARIERDAKVKAADAAAIARLSQLLSGRPT